MRCVCCNRPLNDFEATRRSELTGEFLDTCNKCIKGLGIKTVDREDLADQFNQGNNDEDFESSDDYEGQDEIYVEHDEEDAWEDR